MIIQLNHLNKWLTCLVCPRQQQDIVQESFKKVRGIDGQAPHDTATLRYFCRFQHLCSVNSQCFAGENRSFFSLVRWFHRDFSKYFLAKSSDLYLLKSANLFEDWVYLPSWQFLIAKRNINHWSVLYPVGYRINSYQSWSIHVISL